MVLYSRDTTPWTLRSERYNQPATKTASLLKTTPTSQNFGMKWNETAAATVCKCFKIWWPGTESVPLLPLILRNLLFFRSPRPARTPRSAIWWHKIGTNFSLLKQPRFRQNGPRLGKRRRALLRNILNWSQSEPEFARLGEQPSSLALLRAAFLLLKHRRIVFLLSTDQVIHDTRELVCNCGNC